MLGPEEAEGWIEGKGEQKEEPLMGSYEDGEDDLQESHPSITAAFSLVRRTLD